MKHFHMVHLSGGCLKICFSKIALKALKALQTKDLGLQAILEKMNSLNTPLISGPCGNVSTIFWKFLTFLPSSWPHKVECKLTLVSETAFLESETAGSDSETTKVNLHSTLCGNELGKNVKNFKKIVETFPHGPLIRAVFKEFIFSKIAWSPKSSTRETVRAAKRPWKVFK